MAQFVTCSKCGCGVDLRLFKTHLAYHEQIDPKKEEPKKPRIVKWSDVSEDYVGKKIRFIDEADARVVEGVFRTKAKGTFRYVETTVGPYKHTEVLLSNHIVELLEE